jgi:hypothetical protein
MIVFFWVLHTNQLLSFPVLRRITLYFQGDWIRFKWIMKREIWQRVPPKYQQMQHSTVLKPKIRLSIWSKNSIRTQKLHDFVTQRLLMSFTTYFLSCNISFIHYLIWNKILNRSTFYTWTPACGLTVVFILIPEKAVKQLAIKIHLFGPIS